MYEDFLGIFLCVVLSYGVARAPLLMEKGGIEMNMKLYIHVAEGAILIMGMYVA